MKTALKTALCTAVAIAGMAAGANGQVRISQVYGGAGCGTAGCSAYQNDYVELYNAGPAAVDVSTWSVQYGSAANTSFSGKANLTGMILPGHYYLVQLSGNVNGVLPLPTPDVTGAISMSASNGKVALVSNQIVATGCADASIVDLVGYGGTAICFEGSAAPTFGNNSNAIFRADGGCTDTNSNAADFTAAAAAPRNSTNTHLCGATTGACCVANVCSLDTPANCAGTFQGLGTLCAPDPCAPPPMGACCVSGLCVGDLTEVDCLANGVGSSWGGVGTTCASFLCPEPTGACCNGTTCTSTTQAACLGVWTLNGTCTPTNPCDPAQACCFATGACLFRPSVDCGTLGGTPNGVGSVCTPANPCPQPPPGACCTGANCVLSADPLACFTSGGQFKGFNTPCLPDPCFVAGGTVIATYDFDVNVVGNPATNLSFTPVPDNTATNGKFTSAFDVFGVTDRTANVDIADDSVANVADTVGILRAAQTGKVFGVEDLLNPDNLGGAGSATFTFNVTGYDNLNLSVDCAAFGNFEQLGSGVGSIADSYTFTVSIDGGAPASVIVSNVYEGITPTYTLESGATNTATVDPCALNGSLVLNQFVTLAAPIAGAGSTLTLTFNATNDGGGEAFLFDNIVIRGTPIVAASGACCSGATCGVAAQGACVGANTSYKGNGTVCNVAGNNTAPCCKADFNQSGTVTVQDIFDFLAAYFSSSSQADINGAGGASVQDIFDYLAAYFAGCV